MSKPTPILSRFARLTFLAFLLTVISSCGGGGGGGGNNGQPASNASPTAAITISSFSGYAPFAVALDAGQSSDSDGSIASYDWNVGDGSSYVTSQVSHTYQTLGSFTVTLTVTDNEGATASTVIVVDVYAQAAGFYNGTLESNVTGQIVNVYAQVGSNHKVYSVDYVNWRSAYSGDIDVELDAFNASLQAEIWEPGFVFPDGSEIGPVQASGTVTARIGIDGTYTGVGDSGTLSLTYLQDISSRQASLAEVSGIWSRSDGISFTETMTIAPTGDFNVVATDGCSMMGTVKIMDATLNEFEIEYDLMCPPGINLAGDGRRKGLARIEHADLFGYVDDWFVWDITFQEGPWAGRQGGGALARPPAVSASGGMQSPRMGRDSNGRQDGHAAW